MKRASRCGAHARKVRMQAAPSDSEKSRLDGDFQGSTCEARFDFELNPFNEDVVEFFAEIGNAIEARQFKPFQTISRKIQQRLERRVCAAHGSALPGLSSPQRGRQGRDGGIEGTCRDSTAVAVLEEKHLASCPTRVRGISATLSASQPEKKSDGSCGVICNWKRRAKYSAYQTSDAKYLSLNGVA